MRGDGLDGSLPPGGGAGAPRRPAGALEAEGLAVLRAAGMPLTAGQVRQQLAPGQQADLSYSTLVTLVTPLHATGLLAREQAGRSAAWPPGGVPLVAPPGATPRRARAGAARGAAPRGRAAPAAWAAAAGPAATGLRRRARALAESYRRAARLRADGGLVVMPGNAI